ncbi:hypothetical protein MMC10_000437 [Thelotrema lepadinum]|nr:hypothetical protein [Thelotrema lepadinum]
MERFEELDSDSDDDQGVDLDYMHKSDELYFTGGDIGPQRRHKRRSGYEDYSDDSEVDDDFDEEDEDDQLALREKEEILVARALERIRRAQALGKPNVKLTAAESDALERKMAKDRAKGRKPIIPTKKIGGSPRNSSRTDLVPANQRKTSKSSLHPSPSTNPPDEYFMPSSSRPGSRTNSSQNLKAQPLTRNPKRLVSDPESPNLPYSRSPPTRRPLPDDPNWQPRPRSSSSANPPYPVSPQEYGNYPTPSIPSQYASSSRRNVSGPAELGYPELPSSGRQFPVHMPSVRGYTSSSDPSLPRRRDVSGGAAGYGGRSRGGGGNFDSEDDDDDDEDQDQGVQVDVQASGSAQGYEISVVRNSGGQRGGNASGARARRGRR